MVAVVSMQSAPAETQATIELSALTQHSECCEQQQLQSQACLGTARGPCRVDASSDWAHAGCRDNAYMHMRTRSFRARSVLLLLFWETAGSMRFLSRSGNPLVGFLRVNALSRNAGALSGWAMPLWSWRTCLHVTYKPPSKLHPHLWS
jgi:hypothetical protein